MGRLGLSQRSETYGRHRYEFVWFVPNSTFIPNMDKGYTDFYLGEEG